MTSMHHIQEANRVSTNAEDENLQRFISDSNAKIDAINIKILQLEAQLAALHAEKKILVDASQPYRAALSTFQRLPEDVVREICIACLEKSRYPSMSNTEAPVLLTQICSGMRRIALSTPELWAKIYISIIENVMEDALPDAAMVMSKRAEGVREWLLRRSGNLPLSIAIHSYPEPIPPVISHEIVDIFVSCRIRWRDLFLSCSPAIIAPIAAVTASEAPLLRAISFMSVDSSTGESADIWAESKLLGGENLQQFIFLGQLRQDALLSSYPVKWANITHVALTQSTNFGDPQSDNDIACILQQTTHLTNCQLTLSGIGQSMSDTGPIILPHLKVLLVTQWNQLEELQDTSILGRLRAPALEAVSYNLKTHVRMLPTSLIAMLARSPSVREFRIGGWALHDGVVTDCIRNLPSLSKLYIDASSPPDRNRRWIDGDPLLAALTTGIANRRVCPELEYFRCDSPMKISRQILHNFLARRSSTDGDLRCWKEVVMTVQPSVDERSMVNEAWSQVTGRETKLELTFLPHNAWLDEKIASTVFTGSEDEWWPAQSTRHQP